MTLAGGLILLGEGRSNSQVLIAIAVASVFFCILLRYSPYQDKSDARLAEFACFANILTLQIGLLLRLDEGKGEFARDIWGLLLVLLNSLVVLVSIFMMLRELPRCYSAAMKARLSLVNHKYIKKIPLFSHLPHMNRREICSRMQYNRYKKGQTILKAGDKAETFVILLAGAAEVESKHETQRKLIQAINAFGESALTLNLASDATYMKTVKAARKCEVLTLHTWDYVELRNEGVIDQETVRKANARRMSRTWLNKIRLPKSFRENVGQAWRASNTTSKGRHEHDQAEGEDEEERREHVVVNTLRAPQEGKTAEKMSVVQSGVQVAPTLTSPQERTE